MALVMAGLAASVLAWFGHSTREFRPSEAAPFHAAVVDGSGDGEVDESALRLVEYVKNARIEGASVPVWPEHNARRAISTQRSSGGAGPAAVVTRVALPVDDGAGAKKRDISANAARVGRDHVRRDERDAVAAAVPSTWGFPMVVPRRAKFQFAVAMLASPPQAGLFVVSVRDAMGRMHEICRRITAREQWADESCSLEAFVGQAIELQLSVSRLSPPSSRAPASAVALWGAPTIVVRGPPRLPSNVLWLTLGGLRPEAIEGLRRPEGGPATKEPPSSVLATRTPYLDAVATRGVRFTRAYAAGTWSRPAVFAMLTGARSAELGIGTKADTIPQAELSRFDAADAAILPRSAQATGAQTVAFAMPGGLLALADAGVNLGFERLVMHRELDAQSRDVTSWIQSHRDRRFFAFVEYGEAASGNAGASYERDLLEQYDVAVGEIVRVLKDVGLEQRTVLVVTASPGPSRRGPDSVEGDARVPILIVAPAALVGGRVVSDLVSSLDLAPTIRDLLGMEPKTRYSGRSLLALARGLREADPRSVITEGRVGRGFVYGRYRLVTPFSGEVRLYDLDRDPEARVNVAPVQPDELMEMKAREKAMLDQVPVAGSSDARGLTLHPAARVSLRWVGAGEQRHISGAFTLGDASAKVRSFAVTPVGVGQDALRIVGNTVELSLRTSPARPVGVDIRAEPPETPITWHFYVDDDPLAAESVFGGAFGLSTPLLVGGLNSEEARRAALATVLPPIDPRRDAGLFVVRHSDCAQP